jgi:hypothetical protein
VTDQPQPQQWQPTAADGRVEAGAAPDDRPERAVAAAFAGGFVLALILKRLAR